MWNYISLGPLHCKILNHLFWWERRKRGIFSGIKAICLYKHSDVIYRDCFMFNVLLCSLKSGHVRTHLSPMWKDVLNQWVLWLWLKVTFLSWLEYSFFTVSKGSKCHNHTHMLSTGQRQIQIESMKERGHSINISFEKKYVSIVPVPSCLSVVRSIL